MGMRALARLGAVGPGLFLFLVALAPRLLHLGRSPHRDEMFHVLAAQSLLADGTLIMDEGGVPYTRARPFTYLVAGLFRVFGESLVVARLPGVLAMAVLVALVFWWVRSAVGRKAAWAAALLLCLDPAAIFYSQLGRFYGLHALFFFLGAMGIYFAATLEETRSRVLGVSALAALALWLAYSLQVTALLGVAGLVVWLVAVKGPAWARRIRSDRRRPVLIGLSVLIVAGVAVSIGSGLVEYFWDRYTRTDLWAEGRAVDPLFYHQRLASSYPTLWSLFPAILVIALISAPRIAGISTVIFGSVFILASMSPQKHERYLLFALPFFFTLCGITIGQAIPWLQKGFAAALQRSAGQRVRPRVIRTLAGAGLVAALVFALGSNRAPVTTARMLAIRDADDTVYGWQPNWIDAARTLRGLADSSHVVLSSWPLAAWYYLDRLDVSLHARELLISRDPLPEFAIPAWYLPRPTISEPESLSQLVDCAPSGLVIVEQGHWRTPWVVSGEMADYIGDHLERVALPERWGLLVYRWDRGQSGAARPCDHLFGTRYESAS